MRSVRSAKLRESKRAAVMIARNASIVEMIGSVAAMTTWLIGINVLITGKMGILLSRNASEEDVDITQDHSR
jgi:hypothetical protein